MKKRRLCRICLPVLLWFILAGLGEMREPEEVPRPWKEGSVLQIEGTVSNIQTTEKKQTIYLKNISILSESPSLSHPIIGIKAELQQNMELNIGNRVQLSGLCEYFSKAQNEGEFDEQKYYDSLDVQFLLKKARVLKKDTSVRPISEVLRILRERTKSILDNMMKKEEAGVMESLLLGDKSSLDEQIRDLYRKNGLIHVLAISGLHVSMIGMSIFHFLRRKMGFAASSLLSGILMWMYGMMTGFPVSAIRAILMFYLFLGAQILGRTYDMPTAMMVSGILMLIRKPGFLSQSGFLLSYSAVIGVSAASALPQRNSLFSPLKTSMVTWLVTMPVVAWFYYEVPICGIILNLLIIPSISVIVSSGILGVAAGSVSISLGTWFLAPAHYLLQMTFSICKKCAALPGTMWITGKPAWWRVILYYLVLIMLFLFLQKMKKIDLIKTAFGIILGIGILFYPINTDWSITFLNTGQGDGICIRTERGNTWMIDGGSSTRYQLGKHCLEPYLKYQGTDYIEGWIISHFDQDHISGLMEILERYQTGITGKNENGITIGRILIPDLMQEEGIEKQLFQLAEKNRIPVIRCGRGDQFCQDGMQIFIENPASKVTYENSNAGSMVLRVIYEDFSVLLTGDLEGTGEKQLEKLGVESVDVLKVAHHGSRNSSSEAFLRRLNGKTAVISCGKENLYGHPHEELLKRLKNTGYQIMRTDTDGMIRFCVKKRGGQKK